MNLTAMDYRQYDNALGRFNSVDALAELAPGITPYRFGFNNPICWSDPTGLFESWYDAISFLWNSGSSGGWVSNQGGTWAVVIPNANGYFDSYEMIDGELSHGVAIINNQNPSGGGNTGSDGGANSFGPPSVSSGPPGSSTSSNGTGVSNGTGSNSNPILPVKSRPIVINKSSFTAWYKPENDTTAISIRPGMTTYAIVDGIKVHGVVWKVTDNYSTITIYDELMDIQYPNVFVWFVYMLRGGMIESPPGDGNDWDNLFNAK